MVSQIIHNHDTNVNLERNIHTLQHKSNGGPWDHGTCTGPPQAYVDQTQINEVVPTHVPKSYILKTRVYESCD